MELSCIRVYFPLVSQFLTHFYFYVCNVAILSKCEIFSSLIAFISRNRVDERLDGQSETVSKARGRVKGPI